jgi:opacity protein-like surface antigen
VNALTRLLALLLLVCAASRNMEAQQRYFAGAVGGISTLSADAQSSITPQTAAISLYRPFNGAALNAFAGIHLTDVLGLQANYVYNANNLTVVATKTAGGREDLVEQHFHSTQHAFVGDLLLYFRNRKSWARPYLSAGVGGVRFRGAARNVVSVRGSPDLLPNEFMSTAPALRVAVGIDLTFHSGWAFRYSFSETIRGNPVSGRLMPAGERNLANFQNLFGFVKVF